MPFTWTGLAFLCPQICIRIRQSACRRLSIHQAMIAQLAVSHTSGRRHCRACAGDVWLSSKTTPFLYGHGDRSLTGYNARDNKVRQQDTPMLKPRRPRETNPMSHRVLYRIYHRWCGDGRGIRWRWGECQGTELA